MTVGDFTERGCGAASAQSPTSRLDSCFSDLASSLATTTRTAGPADGLARLGQQRLFAGFGGSAIPERRPLLAILGSASNSGGEFISVAETLASHGYVVAVVVPSPPGDRRERSASEAESASAALRQLVSNLSHDSGVDASRIGLLGWSFGGVPMMLEASRNPRVRAIVSLDSALRYRYGVDLLQSALSIRLDGFRGSMLAVSAGVENPVAKDDSIVAALGTTRVERLVADGLSHADFSDQYGALAALVAPEEARAQFHTRYRKMVADVVAYLDRTMRPPRDAPWDRWR